MRGGSSTWPASFLGWGGEGLVAGSPPLLAGTVVAARDAFSIVADLFAGSFAALCCLASFLEPLVRRHYAMCFQ